MAIIPNNRGNQRPRLPPLPPQLLNITRMIQKREMMKREQLMVQQEIFLQQHWDLTDTTGESRPLGIEPGKYKARPRQPAPAAPAPSSAATAAAGGAAGAGGVPGAAALPVAPVQVRISAQAPDETGQPEGRRKICGI